MNVLLINPPFPACGGLVSLQYPLNLAYIGTCLEQNGFSVAMLDLNVQTGTAGDLAETINRFKPDVTGISVMTPTVRSAQRIATLVKQVSPLTTLVFGGAHVSALPEETLAESAAADVIAIGEGEETMVEVCKRRARRLSIQGVPGILYRHNGAIVREKPRERIACLDALPFPRRDYVDARLYRKRHVSRGLSRTFLAISEMMISRGCPGTCTYCASGVTHAGAPRFRSPANVAAEIDSLIAQQGTTHLSFEDDVLFPTLSFAEELCRSLRERKVTWNCNCRVDMVTKKLLRLMAESGCTKIQFGIESGSEKMLRLMNKHITVEEIRNALNWAREAGIRLIEGSFILGSHPQEDKEDIAQTFALMKELPLDLVMVAIACPFPGTELHRILKQAGQVDTKWDDYLFFGSRPVVRTATLSPKELRRLQSNAYRMFYLNPRYLSRIFRKLQSPQECAYWCKEGASYVWSLLRHRDVSWH